MSAQLQQRFTIVESSYLLALSTLPDPRMKKLAFYNSAAAQQVEQWIVLEMTEYIPVVPTNDARAEAAAPKPATGLSDLFDKMLLMHNC